MKKEKKVLVIPITTTQINVPKWDYPVYRSGISLPYKIN